MRGNFRLARCRLVALVVVALAMIGCSGGGPAATGGASRARGVAPLTGTVNVHVTLPSDHFAPGKVNRALLFTGLDESGAVSFGPEKHAFQDVVILKNVAAQTVGIVVDDPTDASVRGEAPVRVKPGGQSYISNLFLLPVRLGQDGARVARMVGDPVRLGAGYIQARMSAIGNHGARPVTAGPRVVAVSSTVAPHGSTLRASSQAAADHLGQAPLGSDYISSKPGVAGQNAVYPHPWAILYNANPDRGRLGLLLNQERVPVGGSTFVPGPGQIGNSSPLTAAVNGGFDVAQIKVDPGFTPHAMKVNRMGNHDTRLVLRGMDDPAIDSKGLPKDAALAVTAVRGSPMLYFVSVGLPRVTLLNFWSGPHTNASGTIRVAGTDINYTVMSGPTPPDRCTRLLVLFYPASQARYTPSTVVDSTLTFRDPYNGSTRANHFVLCMLPSASFADATTLQKLASAAFSYPMDSKVSYSGSQSM